MTSITFGSFGQAVPITNEPEAATKYSDPYTIGEKLKIADGSHGSEIWEVKATLDSKEFALKSIPEEKIAMTEFAAYRQYEDQSIIRCYSYKKGDNCFELLLEKGECTLHELIKVCKGGSPMHQNANRQNFLTWAQQDVKLWEPFNKPEGDSLPRPNQTPTTTLLSLIRDIIKGVIYLHKMGVGHGRLNPNNILIFKNRDNSLRAKLSHFGCYSSGSPGWQSPEQVKGEQVKGEQGNMNSDKYILGMIVCYAMTGNHLLENFSFFDHNGEMNFFTDVLDHNGEMSYGDVFLFNQHVNDGRLVHYGLEIKLLPDAISLVEELMSPTPTNRLSLKLLELEHPIFWGTSKRGRLVCQKHSFLKQLKNVQVRKYLNSRERKVIVNKRSWLKQVDQKLLDEYKDNVKKRKHQGGVDPSLVVDPVVIGPSVTSLIWFMRNVTEHFEDYTDKFEVVKATDVCKAWDYFFVRFPHLVIECYNYVKNNLLDDKEFEEFLLPLQR